MGTRNLDTTDLTQYMEETQKLAQTNSNMNGKFADALTECRDECTSKLADLFQRDFEALMNNPVETLTLNLKPRVDPEIERAEQQEHETKKREAEAKIKEAKDEHLRLEKKKSQIANFVNENIMKI